MQVQTGSIQCLCIYMRSYLVSFFAYTVCNWLACTAMPRLDIDTTRRVVFLKSTAGYSIHKLWSIGHQQTTLYSILANKIFSYLPTNWLDKLKEVNGDLITNEDSILYTKSILHIRPNSRAWDILHTSTFSVGQWIQGSIRTYRDNIHKFIMYILLIL